MNQERDPYCYYIPAVKGDLEENELELPAISSGRSFLKDVFFEKGMFVLSFGKSGCDYLTRLFLRICLNEVQDGFCAHFHYHSALKQRPETFSLYKKEEDLPPENNIGPEEGFFKFIMPQVRIDILRKLKWRLLTDLDEQRIQIEPNLLFPGFEIRASGSAFHNLGMAFFLFGNLPVIDRFQLLDNLILHKV